MGHGSGPRLCQGAVAARICAAQAQGLSPLRRRLLALRPSSLGVWLECCAWGEGPLGSQTHPLQQAA